MKGPEIFLIFTSHPTAMLSLLKPKKFLRHYLNFHHGNHLAVPKWGVCCFFFFLNNISEYYKSKKKHFTCFQVRGNKGKKENLCWGGWSSYLAAGSSGSAVLDCERASLNLEPRLQDEPWLLILITNFS